MKKALPLYCWLCALVALLLASAVVSAEDKKKIVFLAGNPSHGFGAHDHQAGCMLLAKCLNESGLPVTTEVVTGGWPKDEAVLTGRGWRGRLAADSIVLQIGNLSARG